MAIAVPAFDEVLGPDYVQCTRCDTWEEAKGADRATYVCPGCPVRQQTAGTCRTCGTRFPSGNALFRHLKSEPTHLADGFPPVDLAKIVPFCDLHKELDRADQAFLEMLKAKKAAMTEPAHQADSQPPPFVQRLDQQPPAPQPSPQQPPAPPLVHGHLPPKGISYEAAMRSPSPPPTADQARKEALEREWDRQRRTMAGVCMICPRCGGSSASFCRHCAKERFMRQHRANPRFHF
jgi:hypothetical protein